MMHDRRQEIYLKEMGYTPWQTRQGGGVSNDYEEEEIRAEVAVEVSHRPSDVAKNANAREQARKITREAMGEKPKRPEMAAVLSAEREAPAPAMPAPEIHKMPEAALDDRAKAIAGMDWEELTEAIRACRACELCRHRKQAVPGVGDRAAKWLFIGEGPGAEEDARGEPFVGQAGRLLDAMLAAIDLKRGEKVYIANAVKCRPEGNRTPEPAEMAVCRPFLMRQIALIRPAIIILLGKAATHSVLGDDASLASLRKKTHWFGEVPVVVTYHPAYLLRHLPEKAKAWEDLCLARRIFQGAKLDE